MSFELWCPRQSILLHIVVFAFVLAIPDATWAASEYTISDEFDGCEFGKLYELDGGGILECQEYNYFYEYRPRVIASGRNVVAIGDQRISAYIHDGSVFRSRVSGEFDGCDFGKVYKLDNGLIFECSAYSYTYSYRPEVKIFVIKGRTPAVFIKGKKYDGMLFKVR